MSVSLTQLRKEHRMPAIEDQNVTIEEFFEYLQSYLDEKQIALVKKAYEFAAKKHADQKRRSGEPYIIHPTQVAYILAQMKMDEETLAAAFLHDVVEDTDTTLQQLKEMFGAKVAMLVDGVTKLGKIEYISKEERQIENYRKMFLAMAQDIRVVIIKLADRLHNMRTMKYMPVHKQQSISKETLEIYAPLANRLGIYTIKWELEDMAFRYRDPELYYNLVEQVKTKRKEREDMINNAMETLLVSSRIAEFFVPHIVSVLKEHNVQIYGDERACALAEGLYQGTEQNWATEYDDLILNLVIVDNVQQAISHIETFGTHHSECIVTEDIDNKNAFFAGIDSACLYHNASTRFTDGFEFGLGAEIGISTQKLHARGPMGLRELTSYAYHLEGKGEIR